jgi:hypothetical protein
MRLSDAEWDAEKQRWLDLHSRWSVRLGLTHWNVTFHWWNEPLDNREPSSRIGPTKSSCDTKDGIPAHVFVQPQYMVADIEVDLRLTSNMSDRKLRRLYLHEMMHIVLGEMRVARSNKAAHELAEEHVATWVAVILIALGTNKEGEDLDYSAPDPFTVSRDGALESGRDPDREAILPPTDEWPSFCDPSTS